MERILKLFFWLALIHITMGGVLGMLNVEFGVTIFNMGWLAEVLIYWGCFYWGCMATVVFLISHNKDYTKGEEK